MPSFWQRKHALLVTAGILLVLISLLPSALNRLAGRSFAQSNPAAATGVPCPTISGPPTRPAPTVTVVATIAGGSHGGGSGSTSPVFSQQCGFVVRPVETRVATQVAAAPAQAPVVIPPTAVPLQTCTVNGVSVQVPANQACPPSTTQVQPLTAPGAGGAPAVVPITRPNPAGPPAPVQQPPPPAAAPAPAAPGAAPTTPPTAPTTPPAAPTTPPTTPPTAPTTPPATPVPPRATTTVVPPTRVAPTTVPPTAAPPPAPSPAAGVFGNVTVTEGNQIPRIPGRENQPPIGVAIVGSSVTVTNNTIHGQNLTGTVVIDLQPGVQASNPVVTVGQAQIVGNQVVWTNFSLASGAQATATVSLVASGTAAAASTPAIRSVSVTAVDQVTGERIAEQTGAGGTAIGALAAAAAPVVPAAGAPAALGALAGAAAAPAAAAGAPAVAAPGAPGGAAPSPAILPRAGDPAGLQGSTLLLLLAGGVVALLIGLFSLRRVSRA